jgi:hypothetical protein
MKNPLLLRVFASFSLANDLACFTDEAAGDASTTLVGDRVSNNARAMVVVLAAKFLLTFITSTS